MESGGGSMEQVRDEKEKQQASSENNTPTWANKQRRLSKKKSSRGRSFKLRSDTLNSLRLRRVFDLFDKNCDGLVSVSEIRQALVLLGLDEDQDEPNVEDEEQDHHHQQPEEYQDGDANANADADHHQQRPEEQREEDELDSIVSSFIKPGNQGLAFEDFEALHDSLSNNTFFFDCLNDDHRDQSLNPITKDTTEDDDHEQQVESDLTEAFKVFDSNGDGYISAMELQQVLSKLGFPEAQQELPNIQLMLSSFDHDHDGRVDFFEFKHMMSRTLLLPS